MPVQIAFLVSIMFVAVCGLVYELVAGALASYLLGDSVMQFSTIIGTYLFAMGVGSWLSRYITKNLVAVFVQVELLVGLVGGFSATILFLIFDHVKVFSVPLYGIVFIIGTLVGVELPLVIRILKRDVAFKDLVAKVFAFDAVGALIASLLFPLVLVPHLGLVRTAFFFGMVNAGVALWSLSLFKIDPGWVRPLRVAAVAVLVILATGFAYGERIMKIAEASAFPDPVVVSKSSPYQRLVVTKSPRDLRLFINGNLQFSSRDEYRYHEALVHVGLQSVPTRARVLVLGGGDGLAVREVLRHPDVKTVTVVDLDPLMTDMFTNNPILAKLNDGALDSDKVTVVNADAFTWLQETDATFDFVVVDFPDPSSYSLGKLYTTSFYRELARHVKKDGAFVVQTTSPLAARRSFWCVASTIEEVGLVTRPYHAYVPSFGEWGFILGSAAPLSLSSDYPPGLRFLDEATLMSMLQFPRDMARVEVESNHLNNQALVHYFEDEWSEYVR